MRIRFKHIAILEALVLIILVGIMINNYMHNKKIEEISQTGLLSPRVYTGILEPKSHLIVNFKPLKKKLTSFISISNISASVYVENFRNGAYMGINEKAEFFPASLNKLPVGILIMRDVEQGTITLDTLVQIRDTDRTDSSGDLYKTTEKALPLRVVLEKMMKDSDNTALRVLLHYVDLEDLQFLLDYYGLEITIDTQRPSQVDLISPKAMSNLFSSLYFSTVLNPENSEYLLSLITDTEFDIKKIAGITDDTRIAHKFGVNYYKNNRYFHDCGIMYIDESRIFYCIMTRDIDEDKAAAVIGAIVKNTYTYVVETRAKLDVYQNQSESS